MTLNIISQLKEDIIDGENCRRYFQGNLKFQVREFTDRTPINIMIKLTSYPNLIKSRCY